LGRGFYICPECLSRRHIKIKNRFGIDKMDIKENLKKQILNLIQLGWRGRGITIGFEDTINELKRGKKGFLILAEDISDRTKRNILYKYEGDYFQLFSKDELGRAIGKREVGIIFIPEGKFGNKLKALIKKYKEIE
jgi:ribosomal protein L7Ae-like RNA K-turn-binding protein